MVADRTIPGLISAACCAESWQQQAQPALGASRRGSGTSAATPQPWHRPWAQPALLLGTGGTRRQLMAPLVLAVPVSREVGARPVVHPLRGDGE